MRWLRLCARYAPKQRGAAGESRACAACLRQHVAQARLPAPLCARRVSEYAAQERRSGVHVCQKAQQRDIARYAQRKRQKSGAILLQAQSSRELLFFCLMMSPALRACANPRSRHGDMICSRLLRVYFTFVDIAAWSERYVAPRLLLRYCHAAALRCCCRLCWRVSPRPIVVVADTSSACPAAACACCHGDARSDVVLMAT